MPTTRTLDTAAALRQRVAFDIIPDEVLEEHAEELGLTPSSPDVLKVEISSALDRRKAIDPVTLVIYSLSTLTSDLMRRATLIEGEDPDDAPTPEQIFAASRAIVATMHDMGLVHLPHVIVGGLQ